MALFVTREHPGEDDVEALARLALADDRGAGSDLLAHHLLGELPERLSGQAGEQLDAGELV